MATKSCPNRPIQRNSWVFFSPFRHFYRISSSFLFDLNSPTIDFPTLWMKFIFFFFLNFDFNLLSSPSLSNGFVRALYQIQFAHSSSFLSCVDRRLNRDQPAVHEFLNSTRALIHSYLWARLFFLCLHFIWFRTPFSLLSTHREADLAIGRQYAGALGCHRSDLPNWLIDNSLKRAYHDSSPSSSFHQFHHHHHRRRFVIRVSSPFDSFHFNSSQFSDQSRWFCSSCRDSMIVDGPRGGFLSTSCCWLFVSFPP